MLTKDLLGYLQKQHNLLAFSAGVDSTALFFILKDYGISFDIAIVDYQKREQSKQEVSYAKKLAQKYQKQCHILKASKIQTNFEANARKIRYEFFEKLIEKHSYSSLLTAHHLGDKLEWFLMQFTKGAGTIELCGMQQIEQRETYTLVRPLLNHTKDDLLKYLHSNDIHYFIDETNLSDTFKRNRFRHQFSEKLLQEYTKGIKKSFQYLQEDADILLQKASYQMIEDMCYFQSFSPRSDLINIDKYLKKEGYLLSASEKKVLKERENFIVGRKFLIVFYNQYILITPYIKLSIPMDKQFKEECRKLHIEPKLRPYLYLHKEVFQKLKTLKLKA